MFTTNIPTSRNDTMNTHSEHRLRARFGASLDVSADTLYQLSRGNQAVLLSRNGIVQLNDETYFKRYPYHSLEERFAVHQRLLNIGVFY